VSTASSTLWTSSVLHASVRPRKFRRFDFTGRVDRQEALFGRPGKHHSNSASAPPIISETPQYPEFGLPFSSPAPGPIPSWFIHELKTSAPAIARSARNQEPVRRLINANIIEESERMVKHFLHAGTRKSSRASFLLACRFA
jgi:hypothetical protein